MSRQNRDENTPQPVSMSDADRAEQALRRRGRVDIDAYLQRIDVPSLLSKPLGPTANCLTLDEIEICAAGTVSHHAVHLSACTVCSEAVKAFRAVCERSLADPGLAGTNFFAVTLEPAEIAVIGEAAEFVLLVHTPYAVPFIPSDLRISNAAFEQAHCRAVELADSDIAGRYVYRASCVARLSPTVVRTLDAGTPFVDWLQVQGVTSTGRQFEASDLVRFSLPDQSKIAGV